MSQASNRMQTHKIIDARRVQEGVVLHMNISKRSTLTVHFNCLVSVLCTHGCMHAHACVHTYIKMCVHRYVWICAYTREGMCVNVCICMFACVWAPVWSCGGPRLILKFTKYVLAVAGRWKCMSYLKQEWVVLKASTWTPVPVLSWSQWKSEDMGCRFLCCYILP